MNRNDQKKRYAALILSAVIAMIMIISAPWHACFGKGTYGQLKNSVHIGNVFNYAEVMILS